VENRRDAKRGERYERGRRRAAEQAAALRRRLSRRREARSYFSQEDQHR